MTGLLSAVDIAAVVGAQLGLDCRLVRVLGERTLDDQAERVHALARLGLAVVLAGAAPAVVAREVAALVQAPERIAQMRLRYRDDTVAVGNRTAAAHLLGLVAS